MTGQVILVTGCSAGGIGFSLCEEFASKGCTVYATARKIESMQGFRSDRIRKLVLDVTCEDQIRNVVQTIMEKEGRIDVLVNNAGVGNTGPVIDIPMSDVQRTYEANVFSVVRMAKAVIPHMAARGRGTVVVIGSIYAELSIPWNGIYSSSKAAVHSITDTLYMECMPLGIDVVLVSPGGVKSNIAVNQGPDIRLPPGSLYSSYISSIRQKQHAGQANDPMTTDLFARTVVDELLVPRPPRYLTLGTGSLTSRILGWIPKGWVLRYMWRVWGKDGGRSKRD